MRLAVPSQRGIPAGAAAGWHRWEPPVFLFPTSIPGSFGLPGCCAPGWARLGWRLLWGRAQRGDGEGEMRAPHQAVDLLGQDGLGCGAELGGIRSFLSQCSLHPTKQGKGKSQHLQGPEKTLAQEKLSISKVPSMRKGEQAARAAREHFLKPGIHGTFPDQPGDAGRVGSMSPRSQILQPLRCAAILCHASGLFGSLPEQVQCPLALLGHSMASATKKTIPSGVKSLFPDQHLLWAEPG